VVYVCEPLFVRPGAWRLPVNFFFAHLIQGYNDIIITSYRSGSRKLHRRQNYYGCTIYNYSAVIIKHTLKRTVIPEYKYKHRIQSHPVILYQGTKTFLYQISMSKKLFNLKKYHIWLYQCQNV
jgi:hypothetical protein